MTPVGQLMTGKVGYKPDPAVPVDQQGVCAALATSARHVGKGLQIHFYFFWRGNLARSPPTDELSHSVSQSLPFYWGFQGHSHPSDEPEDLGDGCTVKMRLQAGLVVSPAFERRQPLAPKVTGKPRDLKGDLASS